MNIECTGGRNDCHWNIEGKCTSFEATNTRKIPSFTRNWNSKQNCTLTQIGAHICGAYLPEGKLS